MKKFKGILLFSVFVSGFWLSCARDPLTSDNAGETPSDPQSFAWFLRKRGSVVYAQTITGTSRTSYYPPFYDLGLAAQQIIRNHELIHQRQNSFVTSFACRELEAYRLQLVDTKIWIQENKAESRFDKEALDVFTLYHDAKEMIDVFQRSCRE